jgi:hypothetical protein
VTSQTTGEVELLAELEALEKHDEIERRSRKEACAEVERLLAANRAEVALLNSLLAAANVEIERLRLRDSERPAPEVDYEALGYPETTWRYTDLDLDAVLPPNFMITAPRIRIKKNDVSTDNG